MSEGMLSQVQQKVQAKVTQASSFFEKAAKDNAAAFEAAVETSLVVTKASFGFAMQLTEQWAKLATEQTRRFVPTV
jgi:hypothetical protein